jgi:hypothetical protein
MTPITTLAIALEMEFFGGRIVAELMPLYGFGFGARDAVNVYHLLSIAIHQCNERVDSVLLSIINLVG